MIDRDTREKMAWLFFFAGMAVIALEVLFVMYGQTAKATITYAPEQTPVNEFLGRGAKNVSIVFKTGDGKEHHAFLTDGGPLLYRFTGWPEKGGTIMVRYLPDWPESYVRRVSQWWVGWLIGIVFICIGLYELIKLERDPYS